MPRVPTDAVLLERGVFLDLETVDDDDLDRGRLTRSLPSWDWHARSASDQIATRISRADVVISNRCELNRQALAAARGLRLIALAATGTDKVDLVAARELGITVCNIRNYCSESVAQHVIALMLNLLTRQPDYIRSIQAGKWTDHRQFSLRGVPIREAKGLNFGVIGYGALGQAAADSARRLGMDILVAERKGRSPRRGRVEFEEVLARSDVLSVHCPLNAGTRDLVTRAEISSMKADAILINTARGGIVNEADLADCLREGVIAGAGVDTLSEEPPPANHPLLAPDIPNLLLTPHNAWASRSSRQAAIDQLADIIRAFADGKPFNQVTVASGKPA